MKSENKVALVTGSSQRIGAAIARKLHSQGLTVAIHYRSSEHQAKELTQELNGIRANSAVDFQADLFEFDQILELGNRLTQSFGRLDVLVNNASEFQPNAIGDTSTESFDRMFGVHVKAPYFLVQSALPVLRKAKGCVVNVTDIYASYPLQDYSLYCASKAALEALTKSMALELAPEVRVNAVAPGAILWAEGEAIAQEVISKTPLGRIGSVNELATAVKYLALEATFTTGQTLTVDGGRVITTP